MRRNTTQRTEAIKAVISAAAVAATLAGWAAIATQPSPLATAADDPAAALVELPPIPTLVPLAGSGSTGDSLAAPAHQAPALREVSAPPAIARPAAIAITRSSR
jgi:hypothetical protein